MGHPACRGRSGPFFSTSCTASRSRRGRNSPWKSAVGESHECNLDLVEKTKSLLTAPEVVAATGASYRQVTYWAGRGYIKPIIGKRVGTAGRPPLLFDEEAVEQIRKLKKRSDDLRKGLGAARG